MANKKNVPGPLVMETQVPEGERHDDGLLDLNLVAIDMVAKDDEQPSAQDLADDKLDVASLEVMDKWADEELSRSEKDENDDPDFEHLAMNFDIKMAEEVVATAIDVVDPETAEVHVVSEIVAENTTDLEAKQPKQTKAPMEPGVAMAIVNKTFADAIQFNLVEVVPLTPYMEALELAKLVDQKKGQVAVIFGVQVSYLWAALGVLEKQASENLDRISKDKNAPAFYSNRKNAWIGDVINQAQKFLKMEHNTELPRPGTEFVPQSLVRSDRERIEYIIGQLQVVAKFAICEKDGRNIGIDRAGNPFPQCFTCSQANKPKVAKKVDSRPRLRAYEIPEGFADPTDLESAARRAGIGLQLKGRKPVEAPSDDESEETSLVRTRAIQMNPEDLEEEKLLGKTEPVGGKKRKKK